MLTKAEYQKYAMALYDFCDFPAVRYKILFSFLDTPFDAPKLAELRKDFLKSDVVEEMEQTQDVSGGWGKLMSKDYSVKAKIPTSSVGIERCLYLGLTLHDRDILFLAREYLLSFLDGTSGEPLFEKNERAFPWRTAVVCNLLEAITPYTKECDLTYAQWLYIACRAYESGEYSYERERDAQHEVFFTRENRLIPMQSGLLLKRRKELPAIVEDAMLRHLGGDANEHGHFWDKTPEVLPTNFVFNKTRRWFATFNYINQFRGSALYLSNAVEWILDNADKDGLWDWGSQIKDPWGYFGYFSCGRSNKRTRTVDCTMEILSFLKQYIENNTSEIQRTLDRLPARLFV